MLRLRSACTSAILMAFFTLPSFANTPPLNEVKAVATVVNIEGAGSAKVRKKAGTESLLAAAQELSPGDRITTGPDVLIQLMLPDGSVVRVGANTEYKIESADTKEGVMAWVFSLTKGTVRALVEKAPSKKESKFRVNTPAGTMGVRGTELVLMHSPDSKTTTLFTIEGRVELGPKDCAKKKSCVMVTTGQSATISEGQGKAIGPLPLNLKDLVGASMKMPSEDDQSPAAQAARAAASMMSVIAPFGDRKDGLNGTKVAALDDKALRDMVLKTSQEMIAVQDALMGRDAETRQAMNEAIANGTYDDQIKLAEKKEEEVTGVKKSAEEREKERLSGHANAQKIKVSKQLVGEASAASGEGAKKKTKEGGNSSGGVSSEEMASRIASRNSKMNSYASGASRAVIGSDISGMMKEAAAQRTKAQEELARNEKLVKESMERAKGSATATQTQTQTATASATATATTSSTATATSSSVSTSTVTVVNGGGGGSQPVCAAATTERCGKALTCNLDKIGCRMQKAAQYQICEARDCSTGAYMDWIASQVPAIALYFTEYSNKLGVKRYDNEYSGGVGVVMKNRESVTKQKVCKVEVVPCESKVQNGSPCNIGNGDQFKFQRKEICYEVFTNK